MTETASVNYLIFSQNKGDLNVFMRILNVVLLYWFYCVYVSV